MERRRFRRLLTRVPLHGRALRSGAGIEGHVMNMSEGGFSFETLRAITPREHYEFEIQAPGEGDDLVIKIEVVGQVRWCSPSEDAEGTFWVGVMFEPSDVRHVEQIRTFVAQYTVAEG